MTTVNILFDLDGTLLDTAPDFLYALQQLRKEEGLAPLSPSALLQLRPAVSNGIGALITNGFGMDPEHPDSPILGKRLRDLYQQILGINTKPFPGIESLLTTLEQRNIPWGVVTNKPRELTEPLLLQQNLSHRAACIVSGDTTPNIKPHPEPLFHACRVLKVLPTQCLYIGDAERDIMAGKAAGMTTIAALFGYIEDITLAKKWAAHHYVHHANEILPWLEKWTQSPPSI